VKAGCISVAVENGKRMSRDKDRDNKVRECDVSPVRPNSPCILFSLKTKSWKVIEKGAVLLFYL